MSAGESPERSKTAVISVRRMRSDLGMFERGMCRA